MGPPPRDLRVPLAGLTVFALLWLLLAFRPVNREAWALENVATLLFLLVLVITHRRVRFSDRAYIQGFAFLVLHTVGGHFTYSLVPLGEWLQELLGQTRNPYDRLVHFAFGLLVFAPTRELLFRTPRLTLRRELFITVLAVSSWGMLYELTEWWLASWVAPTTGAVFLAFQGDEWDTQKDMALVTFGAACGAAVERLLPVARRRAPR